MKKSIVIGLILLAVLEFAFGTILNGYGPGLEDCKKSLITLHALLNRELTAVERHRVKNRLAELTHYFDYYLLTKQLIGQLQAVSPALFAQMDNLRDKDGIVTDLYVKLVSVAESAVPLTGATFFSRSEFKGNTNTSAYGEHSVYIQICYGTNALKLLYHELGHAYFVVPRLASYLKFYRLRYQHPGDIYMAGHHPGDQSGRTALEFESRYREDYANYLNAGGQPFESPAAMLRRIRKESDYMLRLARAGS